jgi:hypothetical protein
MRIKQRPRPGDPMWPSAAQWRRLHEQVGGRLIKLESPFTTCRGSASSSGACADALQEMKNPFFIGDQPALTQTSGWLDAWISRPSAYAVAAESTADVVAAVNFARKHQLRLVVKGGGHSYHGTSSAPDSLLIWTRHMNTARMENDFVGINCATRQEPQPAVSIGAGAMWIDAYDTVTTNAGRYVQGGGCTTVGVAGHVQSGGFGSFSKAFGTAASNLLEAEIVTADGQVLIANACNQPDLFWAIKGGGGGTLGVITRLTLRTHPLPEQFGAVLGAIRASSDSAYRTLLGKAISLYQGALFNPNWGEQMEVRGDNVLRLSMVFQGLTKSQAEAIWAPFLAWVGTQSDYSFVKPIQILALPARHFWDADFFRQHAPGFVVADDRSNAPRNHILWAGDQAQVGWFIHSYKSLWLPAPLLGIDRQPQLVDALFAASRHWDVELHFNKGLAGAPPSVIAATRDTATNPAVLDAFALAIIGGSGPPNYPKMPGTNPDPVDARTAVTGIADAMDELMSVAPAANAYVAESDYFQPDWQSAFWGGNYAQLLAIKTRFDPDGLFVIHHGVGSEAWSTDGFTPLA